MANPIVPYAGYSALMGLCLSGFENGKNNSFLRLFKNNIYPDKNTSYADFVECDFNGYAPIPIPAADDHGLTALFIDIWKFAQVSFLMTALPIQPAYGYWVDFIDPRNSSRTVLWLDRFEEPFLFNGPGCKLPVTLTPGFSQGV